MYSSCMALKERLSDTSSTSIIAYGCQLEFSQEVLESGVYYHQPGMVDEDQTYSAE